jgi:hypothetical protein
LRGWFTRWLISENVNNATTVFEWKPRAGQKPGTSYVATLVSCILVGPLLAGTILMGDWYGVGNAGAIILTIVTRLYLLQQQRLARDRLANSLMSSGCDEIKIICVTRSDGKMVTLKVPESLLRTFYLAQDVGNPISYKMARYLAWSALAAHLLILGMSTLVTEIYTVILLVSSTVAMCYNFNVDFDRQHQAGISSHVDGQQDGIVRIAFNDRWDVIRTDPTFARLKSMTTQSSRDRRLIAWAQIQPSEWQEAQMQRWNLLPGTDNKRWWHEYRYYKDVLHLANDQGLEHDTSPLQLKTCQPNTPSMRSAVMNTSPVLPIRSTGHDNTSARCALSVQELDRVNLAERSGLPA